MTVLEKVEKYLNDKMDENDNYIVCKVYDLRMNYDVLEKEVEQFLEYAKIRLENNNYQVYFTGAKYTYNRERKEVGFNKYFIAIKE